MDENTTQRLCYFCQSKGPEFQVIQTEKTQQCSQVWICNNCREKKNFTTSGYSCSSDGGEDDLCDSSDSDLIDSNKYLKLLQKQICQQKFYLKNCWTELKLSLDLLYQSKTDMDLTEAIAELIPRQSELECYCKTLCKEDNVQLLERLDQQCRSYIVHSKRKLFGIAQQKAFAINEINYSSRFLTCALDDWEKYYRVSRAISTIIYSMEAACNIHWRTQSRCIYHRIIYTNIDIHEKLRFTSNHIQQEANTWDEKKDYRYRGILRRYRKLEEHMTNAGKDRDPDICRPSFGEEWRIEGERKICDRDLLLTQDSSGSESIPENLSESGSSNYTEPQIDFNNAVLPPSFQSLWEDGDDYGNVPDGLSVSSSETTESSESFETENYPLPTDFPTAVMEVFAKCKNEKNSIAINSRVNPIPRTIEQNNIRDKTNLLGQTMERILKATHDKKTIATNTTKTTYSKAIKEEEKCENEKMEYNGNYKDSSYLESEEGSSPTESNHGDCNHDCSHDHAVTSDHATCRCVHCELLGNTPTHKGDIRNEMMRDRLRKKLKKRKEQQLKKESAPSPSLSSSTQSRDKSEVDLNRKNSIEKQKLASKRSTRGFGFGHAMEVQPVRHSTSSKNRESDQSKDSKREWIEIASEEFRDIAERESLSIPRDSSLLTLQSSLYAGIELRLDPTLPAQLSLLEEEEARRKEKEKEREKREKRRKKRDAKKTKEKQNFEMEPDKQTSSTDSGNVPDCPTFSIVDVAEEDIDCIFAPKEFLEDLDPDDRDVEKFKKFCLDSAPILPRLKLPLQSLNLLPLVE